MNDMRLIVNEFDIEAVGDEWESLVSAGQMIAEAHDRNRWSLGDLGNKCERRYKDGSLGKYAAAINVRPTTMYDYAKCSLFYDADDRAAFPPLTWSHYRVAMKAKDHDLAMNWLARAADEGWTVEELEDSLKVAVGEAPKARKLLEFGGQFVDLRPVVNNQAELVEYSFVLRVPVGTGEEINAVLKMRGAYTLKVYGQGGEDDAE